MYGFVNYALEQLVLRNFGEEIWEKIKKEADLELQGQFIQRVIYDDACTFNLVGAASSVLNTDGGKILELFGSFFFDFCQEAGYDVILRSLGSSVREFLENLDALHDHLSSIYPGMRAPSFRCTDGPKDNSLILHYYSEREGLECIVMGIVKAVTKQLHDTETEIKVIKRKGDDCDHIQFEVTSTSGKPLGPAIKNISAIDGTHTNTTPIVGPRTFCKALPFHLMFDRNMVVRQAGASIARIVSVLQSALANAYTSTYGDDVKSFLGGEESSSDESDDCNLSVKIVDLFDLARPQTTFLFESILSQINQVFVLRTKRGLIRTNVNAPLTYDVSIESFLSPHQSPKTRSGRNVEVVQKKHSKTEDEAFCLRLKGQMMYVPECDQILFLCSPSVMNLDDLMARGLYMSDIPLHDATRDLLLVGEQFKEDYKLAQSLEILTDKLQHTLLAREREKKMTDKLLYAVLPHWVANELRHKRQVAPMRFENVTILFSSLVGFNHFCAKHTSTDGAMKIVQLLNYLYTTFDRLTDPKHNPHVYKVETVGDKYMAVSGLPEPCHDNAKHICELALGMMKLCQNLDIEGETIEITIGIHTGEVVTGVIGQLTPRYCLFGNTVNISSRCESTGVPGKINVSENTYNCYIYPSDSLENEGDVMHRASDYPDQHLETPRALTFPECYSPHFEFVERGPVQMKGKAEPTIMYLLSEKAIHETHL